MIPTRFTGFPVQDFEGARGAGIRLVNISLPSTKAPTPEGAPGDQDKNGFRHSRGTDSEFYGSG
jgi:hypothetical protein